MEVNFKQKQELGPGIPFTKLSIDLTNNVIEFFDSDTKIYTMLIDSRTVGDVITVDGLNGFIPIKVVPF